MTTTPTSHWLESLWSLPKENVDDFQSQLMQLGCLGSYEKMGLDPEEESRRRSSEFIAYFADGNPDVLRQKLKTLENEFCRLVTLTRIPQAAWATEWKKYFKPFFLTPEIVIRPSWEDYVAAGDEKIVTLDPGMAFGTGQHDTTRFCAELICDLFGKLSSPETSSPANPSLIDVGCGSGILSIIAKKTGFAEVSGFDIDPAAIETSLENLTRNPDVGPIRFFKTEGGLKNLRLAPATVVVSNIIAETLCELKQDLLDLVEAGGFLILSGIMAQRESMVKSTFADLELVEEKKSADWHAYLYRKGH
jgi:ribosomal protein L11 methyltransferase